MIAAMFLAALVLAADPALAPLDIVWETKPTDGALPAFTPRDTRRMPAGEVLLNCRFTADGRLEDCVALKEIPDDYGLAAWTIKVAALYRARSLTRTGEPVVGKRISIPFRFVEPTAAPATSPGRD